ncbi:hypothetical protein QSJ18_18210 [Gordonia sp. ABSL1-1]|uniref:hypothetical protein n=1 Tax=Gordonia sp. ABSL1-1 TaxID=3053923 RepID=UPI0025734301|nr:hypothetical protein [Gordonia sp. ABSL1-1]MDL9938684.1 hypothetical protein [Gordonia sp. ABSL1-1]
MKVVRRPRDGAALVKAWLKERAAVDHPELRVVLELPSDWTLGSAPVLLVADDGGPLAWPVATQSTIRVTSWTSGRDRTYVHWALGLLLGSRVPDVAAILPGTGILDARDDKTRGDLASFTVRLRLRTV